MLSQDWQVARIFPLRFRLSTLHPLRAVFLTGQECQEEKLRRGAHLCMPYDACTGYEGWTS